MMTFSVGSKATAETFEVSLTAGVGVRMMVLSLEELCGWMNSVDKKEMIWWHWTGLVLVCQLYCHCGSCFVLELLKLVLNELKVLWLFCISNLLAGSEELKP